MTAEDERTNYKGLIIVTSVSSPTGTGQFTASYGVSSPPSAGRLLKNEEKVDAHFSSEVEARAAASNAAKSWIDALDR